MFDASRPSTLPSLEKWWKEFQTHAPVRDEEATEFCTAFVGNKMDLVERRAAAAHGGEEADAASTLEEYVSFPAAKAFVESIIPPPPPRPASPVRTSDPTTSQSPPSRPRTPTARLALHRSHPSFTSNHPPSPSRSLYQTASRSIAIAPAVKSLSKSRGFGHSRSRSRSRSQQFAAGTVGTMGTMTTTTFSIYHTPSSSIYEDYASARSESLASASRITRPSASTTDLSRAGSPAPSQAGSPDGRPALRRITSLTMSATSSATTVKPLHELKLTRSRSPAASFSLAHPPAAAPRENGITPLPPRPERGPRIFFTSAKTGMGVSDVFAYIAARVVKKWEYDEAEESRRMSVWDAPMAATSAVRLGEGDTRGKRIGARCCAT